MDAREIGGFAGLWVSQSEHPVSETHGRAIGREHFGFSYAGYACRVHPPLRNLRTLRSYMIGPADRKRNDPNKDCLKLITARKWEKKLWANVKFRLQMRCCCLRSQMYHGPVVFCNPSLPWVTSLTTLASEFFVGPTYWYADFGYYQVQPATQWHCSICLHVG